MGQKIGDQCMPRFMNRQTMPLFRLDSQGTYRSHDQLVASFIKVLHAHLCRFIPGGQHRGFGRVEGQVDLMGRLDPIGQHAPL